MESTRHTWTYRTFFVVPLTMAAAPSEGGSGSSPSPNVLFIESVGSLLRSTVTHHPHWDQIIEAVTTSWTTALLHNRQAQ